MMIQSYAQIQIYGTDNLLDLFRMAYEEQGLRRGGCLFGSKQRDRHTYESEMNLFYAVLILIIRLNNDTFRICGHFPCTCDLFAQRNLNFE